MIDNNQKNEKIYDNYLDINGLTEKSVFRSKQNRVLKNHESRLLMVQMFLCYGLVVIAFFASAYISSNKISDIYKLLLTVTILLTFIIYPLLGVYKQSSGFTTMVCRITIAWVITVTALIVIGFLTKTSGRFSREMILEWFFLVAVLQVPMLKLKYYAVSVYRNHFTKPIPAVIIGLGKTARYLANKVNDNYWLPDKIVGMVDGLDERVEPNIESELSVPLMGKLSDIKRIIRVNKVKRVYVSLPLRLANKVEELNDQLIDFHVDVIWVLDVSDWQLVNHSVREIAGIPILCLNESPVTASRVMISVKHIFDKVFSLLILLLLSPLLVVVAIAVKTSSSGSVIFKQQRHGYDGSIFNIWKFRTMHLHIDNQAVQAVRGDLRITKIGAFLRRTSIDELPQLFNVLQGTMSLVGPRPHAVEHNNFYSKKISAYLVRHRIKPGITGLAQINGCRGETETLQKMQRRIDYDLEYIHNWSLWFDFEILLKTPVSLISKDIY